MFVVIVTASRDYTRALMINDWLDGLYAEYGDELFIKQGGAKGGDKIAKEWCQSKWTHGKYHDHMRQFDAEWDVYGKAAGHLRNQQMLEEGHPVDLVLGFKDNFNWALDKGGTEDMIRRGKDARIPSFVIQKAV